MHGVQITHTHIYTRVHATYKYTSYNVRRTCLVYKHRQALDPDVPSTFKLKPIWQVWQYAVPNPLSEHVSQFPGQAVQELKVDEDEVEVKV